MRRLRHLIGALLLVVVLLVGALAFALFDPLSGGPRFLSPSQLITAANSGPQRSLIGAEEPIEQTDPPARAALALRYQPTLVVSGIDRFWPTSLLELLGARWDGHPACIYIARRCRIRDPGSGAFASPGSRSDYIRFPAPVDSVQDTFLSASGGLGVTPQALREWPQHLADVYPFASAQIYFYYLARAPRNAYPGVPHGLISLEYWFYYPLNYFPLLRIPLEGLSDSIGSTIGNTDYHQGDLEHVAVLLDPRTMRPRYLWMARHADEGQAYAWHSRSVQWSGDHAVIYAALGSHASYAHCGIQRRSRTYFFINDYVVCIPHRTYGFTYSSTPLVDLAQTVWGCWRGRLGQAGSGLLGGTVGFAPYETYGPVSPLFQQENFRSACRVAPGTPKPAPQL
jgi:hypothetical protein